MLVRELECHVLSFLVVFNQSIIGILWYLYIYVKGTNTYLNFGKGNNIFVIKTLNCHNISLVYFAQVIVD